MFFGAKKGRFDPLANRPKGTHPPLKHVFGCTDRKSTLLRVSCGRIEGSKKKFKKHAMVQLHPYAHPTPHFRWPPYFACGSDCGRKHTCQISSESVQGFRSLRWPKMTIPHWLGTSPLQQCNVPHCDSAFFANCICDICNESPGTVVLASTTNKLCRHSMPTRLVTLTFDLLTLKVVSESRVTWLPLCQF